MISRTLRRSVADVFGTYTQSAANELAQTIVHFLHNGMARGLIGSLAKELLNFMFVDCSVVNWVGFASS